MDLPRAQSGYGWAPIPRPLCELPGFLVDLDGTLRGDVVPMVKLAGPLVPDYLAKLRRKQPINAYKAAHFAWDLLRLWALRIIFREHRRRYKRLFSELHHLAASLLHDIPADQLRARYRKRLPKYRGLWSGGGVELLRRLTADGVVVLVTGSEQLQTEECVRLLADRGVRIDRMFVRGSLYGFDASRGRFTRGVQQLNVTLDGKRDAVRDLLDVPGLHIAGAVGNSRPDRALFEAVFAPGLCVLVCPRSVVRDRKRSTFVIRKLQRTGYRVAWDAAQYTRLLADYAAGQGRDERPVLITDAGFDSVLKAPSLREYLGVLFRRIAIGQSRLVGKNEARQDHSPAGSEMLTVGGKAAQA
jgi:phosphoserine phosphatase